MRGDSSQLKPLTGLEGHLEDFISHPVSVEIVDGHGGIFIVAHSDEAEAFALVCFEVADDLHVNHSTEGTKHLPQHGLIGFWGQVVNENAPAIRTIPTTSMNIYGRVPEALGLVADWSSKSARLVRLGRHLIPCLIRGSSKLDRDWFRGTRWSLAIKGFNGIFCLRSLIKTNKGYAPRKTRGLIHKYSGGYDAPKLREQVLQFLLTHCPGQSANV